MTFMFCFRKLEAEILAGVNDLSVSCQKRALFLASFLSCPTLAVGSRKKVI